VLLVASGRAGAQDAPTDAAVLPVASAAPAAPGPFKEERILGVIPDFQTITDPGHTAPPLTVRQKWKLALKQTIDPFNIVNAALGASLSQAGNETPKYGEGGQALGKRFGAALADFGTQNFFSAGVLATLLHQDPRYFRKGAGTSVPRRVVYSLSRLVITRQDSGKAAFNASGIFGMMLGIGASNLYYPSASVHGSVMCGRVETSLFGGVSGNLLSEFWPDLQQKFFHRKHRPQP
jgi:hypothetical protein